MDWLEKRVCVNLGLVSVRACAPRPVHRRSCDAAERRLLIDARLKVDSGAHTPRAAPDAAAARGPFVAQVA